MSDALAGEPLLSDVVAHLIELRGRMIRALLGFVLVAAAALPFAPEIYSRVAQPLTRQLPRGAHMIATDVAAPFFIPIKLALMVALFTSVPWMLYQAWGFVAPALYRREKALAKPLLASAVLLFYAGVAFAYFLVLPAVFRFLVGVSPEGVTMATDMGAYVDFVLALFLAFALSFELPVVLVVLVALGWVTPAQLSHARGYAVVGIFIVAAIVTPPDVVSQLMLAIPMIALYEAGLLAARVLYRSRSRLRVPA